MFADILHHPIEAADIHETGALGCAVALAYATGAASSVEEAVKNMVHFRPIVYPQKKLRDYYDARYELYLKTAQALDGLWPEMRAAIENLGVNPGSPCVKSNEK